MSKRQAEGHVSLEEIALLCTQVMPRCECEGCNRYATFTWSGFLFCDSCRQTKIHPNMIVAPEAEPEEVENASAVRKLASLLKGIRESKASPRRVVANAPEVIYRQQPSY